MRKKIKLTYANVAATLEASVVKLLEDLDTAAALRANEISADIVIKATQVDGVYSADPKKDPTATRFTHLTYDEVLRNRLKVMDLTAFTLCQENNMPILVVDFWALGDLMRAIQGDSSVGTIIKD